MSYTIGMIVEFLLGFAFAISIVWLPRRLREREVAKVRREEQLRWRRVSAYAAQLREHEKREGVGRPGGGAA